MLYRPALEDLCVFRRFRKGLRDGTAPSRGEELERLRCLAKGGSLALEERVQDDDPPPPGCRW